MQQSEIVLHVPETAKVTTTKKALPISTFWTIAVWVHGSTRPVTENKFWNPVHCHDNRPVLKTNKGESNSPNNGYCSRNYILRPQHIEFGYSVDNIYARSSTVPIDVLEANCAELRITLLMTTKYDSETNVQLEQYEAATASRLYLDVAEHQGDWESYVAQSIYSYRV